MQIDWWTLALQAVNFLVLVWLLQRVLFRPVQKLIEARKDKLGEVLRAAEKKLAEAEAEKARYEELIAAFEASKEAKLRDFQKRLDSDRDAVMARARESADAMVASAREEILKERRQAIETSRAELVDLARQIASRILASRARDADLTSDVAAALGKLASLPDHERRRLLKSIQGGAAIVTVETSDAINEAQQSGISTLLHKEFGEEVHVAFAVKPELLGGARIMLPHAELDASWASYLDDAVQRVLESGHERKD